MNTITGLPAHPLLVHLAVVVIPLTGLLAVLTATWPAGRRRLGVITPLVALVAVVVTPLTASAGEALEKQVPRTGLLHKHTEIGGQMNYWVAALFVVVVLFWAAHDDRLLARVSFALSSRTLRWSRMALAAGCVVVGVGAVIVVVLVGDSGARAVWLG
ncbi:DUF2231 domain-containing protein [Gordonia aichiensis]|uniref:DUF2231 domain-containing protein n=1 Tax=Gordonia aichiensis NBRC 108223 TaxID=1220583 RepID=L7KQR5_9ACTN|nr:DUF2231 domain-containing protein [Gordonia aichiensis]GAC50033.1 hypothetical protein GOACH_19_00370 [Gordonia aichiensis NBRC 108223]